MAALRLAIIGCGAITEQGHLPAVFVAQGVKLEALVDRDLERAQRLAKRHGVPSAVADYHEMKEGIDAAIVALPPALHAPVSIDLLERGVHVLVEKPMGMNPRECDAMIAAAKATNATLAVGLVRRFQRGARFARAVIMSGALGRIVRADVREGGVFNWPVASAFFLSRAAAGGGVLADAGVHALDLLSWWFGEASVTRYRDDAFGGVEADCELDLLMDDGVAVHVELSRTRSMRNTTIIEGDRGTLEIGAYDDKTKLTLNDPAARGISLGGSLCSTPDEQGGPMADQLRDFALAIRGGGKPTVSGEEGRRSVALIQACYAARSPLEHAWVFDGIKPGASRRQGDPVPTT